MPILLAASIFIGVSSVFVNQTGDAVEKTGDSATKLLIAGTTAFVVYKMVR